MIGAKDKLAARLGPGFSMNAKVGRQADEFVEIVAAAAAREGHHPDAMIIQMGNNGPLYGEDMEAIRKATSGVGELFLINDHAPVSWVEESNDALAEAAEDWPHTTLIDWQAVGGSPRRPALGRHPPDPGGAGLYARLVSAAVREKVAFPLAPPQAAAARASRQKTTKVTTPKTQTRRAAKRDWDANDDVVDAGDDPVALLVAPTATAEARPLRSPAPSSARFGDEVAADVRRQTASALFGAGLDVDARRRSVLALLTPITVLTSLSIARYSVAFRR